MDIWTNPRFIFVALVFIVLWLMAGAGAGMFVVYRILRKFNDFGDSTCSIDEYSRKGIHYSRQLDEVPPQEKTFLFANFGANPYEGVEHSVPEQLIENGKKYS